MRNGTLFSYAKDNYQKFFYVINKKNYIFRATLINADGIIVELQKDAIIDLTFNDKLFNPFIDGYMTVDNTDDVIERYVSTLKDTEFNNALLERGYKTRGDARDILLLSIIPTDPSNNPYDDSLTSYNQAFGLQYAFVIVDEMDIATPTGKAKRYKIKDLDEQILKEKKIFFSTASLSKNKNVAFLSDTDRKAHTGDAMKEILYKGLGINTVITGDDTGTTPYFESGASKIFYSSPNNNTALDDLYYIYKYHVSNSTGKDFSFLQKDNYTGEYYLESASSIFSKAFDKKNDAGGEYFIENLTITGTQNQFNSNVTENDTKKPLYALEFGETSDIIDVKFFNTPGDAYQENVKSVFVHSYNFEDKAFDIDQTTGNIENVKEDFTKYFVTPLKGKNNGNPSPNFIINNTHKTNQSFENAFLVYSNSQNDYLKQAVGKNAVLKNALKLNLGVEITVQGGIQRKSGLFLSVDRRGSYVDNDFDNKFLGIYLILQVTHNFTGNNDFTTKIMAVKTYHFTDPHINENIS